MNELCKIRTHLSAPSQRRPAACVSYYAPVLRELGATHVADFGRGRLRNRSVLKDHFDRVDYIEQPELIEKICDQVKSNSERVICYDEWILERTLYDAIFLIFVIHTIPSITYRKRIIFEIKRRIRKGGFLLVAVPQSETYYNRRKEKSIAMDG